MTTPSATEGATVEVGAWPIPWQAVEGVHHGPLAWAEYLAARGALGGLGRLPYALQCTLVAGIARLARRVDRRHTRAARVFVAQALRERSADEREDVVLAAWRHFLALTVRNSAFHRHVRPEDIVRHYELHLCDDALRVRDARQGGLVVSCHVGDWEAGALVMPALGFGPFYGVARPPRNAPLSRFVQRQRERYGMRILARHGAVAAIPRVVAAGGYVGLLMDQRARKKTVLAPFFGRLAHCERTIAVLVKRLRAPLLLSCCYVTDVPFRYELHVPRVIWPDELAGLDPQAIVTRLNAELEHMILARPRQYFWLHDRYAKAPPA
jgi:KDO2-lipid IV(A) lauroyltransferase